MGEVARAPRSATSLRAAAQVLRDHAGYHGDDGDLVVVASMLDAIADGFWTLAATYRGF